MSAYTCTLGGERYRFDSLARLLAAASPERSGDRLAGLAARDARRRVAARWALSEVPLTDFLTRPLIPYEDDDVTRLILDGHDPAAFAPVASMTVGELREWLLSEAADAVSLAALAPGLTPETVAAVSKLMGNADLVAVARKVRVVTAFRSTIGLPGRLATRLQPNHPTDDPAGVAAALLDGLLLGSGDAVIGVNPATDSPKAVRDLLELLDEVIGRYAIPTQSCVLCHVTTSLDLMERGAPVDLVFQSVAGTQAANASFGVTLGLLDEAYEAALALERGTVGRNVMYFETGQGSALSAGAHHGVDQQTVEARAYAVARRYDPLLVNTVVGFIGPEYLYDGRQILRAALEDHFCGKLLGLPMGLDICYTNHADADDDDIATMLTMLGVAGASFVICTPGGDDIMLNYQSASYHDALYLREVLGLRPAPEFEAWLDAIGLLDRRGGIRELSGPAHPLTEIATTRSAVTGPAATGPAATGPAVTGPAVTGTPGPATPGRELAA
ncbi:ethanolamine ammonia-lyase large subunit [Streptomyces sp. 3330]|uniref:ethanolamine ammonia-lyase subunit EutB n=1 Tax=Streptomyces sp. 3330 TaxID=2817755 RepID=UPI00286053B7|nr:ethanolamine ammonia-lyase subunit EutB [Streptomyces sp. 3330]MDR6976468.1 ethanolamine ammonia-lyase large subunit [Streptomyces sp. 3330]